MDKAKQAVSGFLNKDGKHDTTVHETINPAVTNEHVIRTQHNEAQTAIDREVHQDHYHTSVQPVKDKEVLPEQHTHHMAGIEHRNIKHGNDDHVKQRLAQEAGQFKNTREVGDIQHSSLAGATIAGEHIHHHVHENIQPVVQKETVQPSVVHTTIPIHEVHQNEAKHHNATQLPAVSMGEFTRQGGHLGGREERSDAFQGEPRSVGGTLGGAGAHGTTSLTENEGRHGHSSATSGPHSSNSANKADPRIDSNRDGSRIVGNTTSGYTGTGTTGHSTTGHSNITSGPHSSNAANKVDPRIDSDHDRSRTVGGNNYTTSPSTARTGTAGLGTGAGSSIGSDSTAPRTTDTGVGARTTGAGTGHSTTGTGIGHSTTNTSGTSATHKKPSLMDKLNPKIDSNGDGKAGFMK